MIESLFVSAAALNAFLLFSLQPLIAKSILPLFGGSPSVWSTCLVFFQITLLLGYLLAHVGNKFTILQSRLIIIQTSLVIASILIGGITISLLPQAAQNISQSPILILLGILILSCGMHAIVLSSGAPFQQSVFAKLFPSKNPYRLYSASNYGSLLGLLSYPLLIEPNLTLSSQISLWKYLYIALGFILSAICFVNSNSENQVKGEVSSLPIRYNLEWFILPSLSSALLVSITSYISTDIAPVPLMWVLPFAIFLVTYAVTFKDSSGKNDSLIRTMTKIFTLILIWCLVSGVTDPLILVMPLFFIAFTLLCLFLHKKLYDLRPHSQYLTQFYIAVSVGGCIGGLFSSCAAPVLFSDMRELPIILVVSLYFTSYDTKHPPFSRNLACALFGLSLTIIGYGHIVNESEKISEIYLWLPPIILAYMLDRSSKGLAIRLALVVISGFFIRDYFKPQIYRARNFFGTLKIIEDSKGIRSLIHGMTLHGSQFRSRMEYCEPTTYYHPEGPAGNIFKKSVLIPNIGIIGLGTGALACYGTASQHFTFFEINPLVAEIANNTSLYTFLKNAHPKTDIILGDARLSIRNIPDNTFGLLVVDAFSSDSIPVHLITSEAIKEYLRVLSEDGALLIHISNKYLDLAPVIAGLAHSHSLHAAIWNDTNKTNKSILEGKFESDWVLLSPSLKTFENLSVEDDWKTLPTDKILRWTDDYSSIVQIFHPLGL